MYKGQRTAAIIAAAGSGSRMGGGVNKQYMMIGALPVLARSVKAFNDAPAIDDIYIVVRETEAEMCRTEIVDRYRFDKVRKIIAGGDQRQDSVYNALRELEPDISLILVHDGARPLVGGETINEVVAACEAYGAAAAGVPIKDTVKVCDGKFIASTPDRSSLISIQTPQGFRKEMILHAFRKAYEDGFYGTDETVLLERLNEKVYIVMGEYSNIKVTTPEDIAVCEALLNIHPGSGGGTVRVGTGYDVHAFADHRKLILGGVEIPFEKGLLGHSDADVLLHAIMDALLGACALADIGRYFPDTDENYRGISSLVLLEKVGDLIGSEGYDICNIDATVIAERPKIAPYIHQMIKHIAEVLKISEDKVNIKGTTTEGLGFCGRGEGIAAQAIVAVEQQ